MNNLRRDTNSQFCTISRYYIRTIKLIGHHSSLHVAEPEPHKNHVQPIDHIYNWEGHVYILEAPKTTVIFSQVAGQDSSVV